MATDTTHEGPEVTAIGQPAAGGPSLLLLEWLALVCRSERLISAHRLTVRRYINLLAAPPQPGPLPPVVRRSALPPRAGPQAALALALAHLAGLLMLDPVTRPSVLVTLAGLATVVVGAALTCGRVAADVTAASAEGPTVLRLSSSWAAPLLLMSCLVSGALGANYAPHFPWAGAVLLGCGPLAVACIESAATHPRDRAERAQRAAAERARRGRQRDERRVADAMDGWGRAHRALGRCIESVSARADARGGRGADSGRRRDAAVFLAHPRAVLAALTPDPRTAAEAARAVGDSGWR